MFDKWHVNCCKKVKFICGDDESKVYEVKSKEVNFNGNDDIELHFTEEFGNDVCESVVSFYDSNLGIWYNITMSVSYTHLTLPTKA